MTHRAESVAFVRDNLLQLCFKLLNALAALSFVHLSRFSSNLTEGYVSILKKKNSRATISEARFILRMFKTLFLLHFPSIFYHNVVLFAEKGNRIKTLYIWFYLPPLARMLSNYAPLFHSGQYLNPAVRWVKLYLQNVSTYSCTQKNIIGLEKKRSCSSDEVQDNDKQTWRNTILYIIIPRPNWRHNSWTFEL